MSLTHNDIESEALRFLHHAAYLGDDEEVCRILKEGHVNVNATNFDSVSALHVACLAGKASTAKLLLEAGAAVNARNIDGATPLCEACCNGCKECVRLLLKHGATVNPQLLLSSPLHEAVLRDNWECAEILIENGANTESMDCHYGTPLHIAAFKNHLRSAQVLLRNGANVAATKSLESVLHFAAARKSEEFIALLLDHGADIYAKNNHGRCAIDFLDKGESGYNLLAFYQKNPRSLLHFCCLKIRKYLHPCNSMKIHKLPLPVNLIDFLDFRNNGILA